MTRRALRPCCCTIPRAVTISNVPPPGSSCASLTLAPCSAKNTPDMATIANARSCSRRAAAPPGDARPSRLPISVPVMGSSENSVSRVRS